MKTPIRALLAALTLAGLSAPALAQTYRRGPASVVRPWTSSAIAGNEVSAFADIRNGAMNVERLLAATSERATEVRIMRYRRSGEDAGTLQTLDHGFAIPPGAVAKMGPQGLQLRLIGLKQSLADNSQVEVTLIFERAGAITVPFDVRPAAPLPAEAAPAPVTPTPDAPMPAAP